MGQVAFGNDTESPNRWRRTFAHEIGHNFGLDHSELTTAGRHWFDVYERRIKPAPGYVLLDVMQPERLDRKRGISPTITSIYWESCVAASVRPSRQWPCNQPQRRTTLS